MKYPKALEMMIVVWHTRAAHINEKNPRPELAAMACEEKRTRRMLFQTGWFELLSGPCGAFPVQAAGVLKNGQCFEFWARGQTARLRLFAGDLGTACVRTFQVQVDGDCDTASLMTSDTAAQLMITWLGEVMGSSTVQSQVADAPVIAS